MNIGAAVIGTESELILKAGGKILKSLLSYQFSD
jgi:hypothetical protein